MEICHQDNVNGWGECKAYKKPKIGNFIITYFDIPYFKDQVQGKSSLVEIGIKIGTIFHKMNVKIQASTVHITFT